MMESVDIQPHLHTGTGMIQENAPTSSSSHVPSRPRISHASNLSKRKVDMVDSYLTSVTSSNVTCIDISDAKASRKLSLTGSSKRQTNDAPVEKSVVQTSSENSDYGEATSTIPGLSIITWEEFIDDPSLLHKLFSKDKSEFISFDCNIVNNFFHDSRMDPPLLGGPSGDGLSWTIFVDSYSQLSQVREVLTTRISVLLVDLVKPNNQGTASCLVAINPADDHIRRVLHLTLSRAMESVFADRQFSVEIDLNESVGQWCQAVLEMECKVQGGRVVVTNGDPVEPFCLIDSRAFCVLAFPVWLYRRIRYLTHRKRHYNDTLVQFEGVNFILCTRSDTLRQHSEAVQLSTGQGLIHRNTNAVTAATQTLNTSTTSLESELSLQEIEEASDNDAIKRREVTSALSAKQSMQNLTDPLSKNKTENPHKKRTAFQSTANCTQSYLNEAFTSEDAECNDSENDHNVGSLSNSNNLNGMETTKNVRFNENNQTVVLENVAKVIEGNSISERILGVESSKKEKTVQYASSKPEAEEIPSPRNAFLLRPDTPFHPTPKPRKSKADSENGNTASLSPLTSTGSESKSDSPDNNDKIVKRQKKISNLLKDLISFSSPSYNIATEHNDVRGTENESEMKISSPRYQKNNFLSSPSRSPVKLPRKTSHTPVKKLRAAETPSVFPYTSDLLSFPAMSPDENVANLEKYGAKLKQKDSSKKMGSRTEDMLFMPRLNLEEVDPDRNCFSDQDVADSDVTDLEQEQDGAMSDTEGILSSRLIPVYSTDKTLSIDSVAKGSISQNVATNSNRSDKDSELEITDCEVEEPIRDPSSPRVLPGAMAAQQLRSLSAHSRSRDYIPPCAQMNRRGGTQNDSRRRYLALNSLRRKAYKLALQSQIRSQKRPSSAELMSYNSRPSSGSHIAFVSKV